MGSKCALLRGFLKSAGWCHITIRIRRHIPTKIQELRVTGGVIMFLGVPLIQRVTGQNLKHCTATPLVKEEYCQVGRVRTFIPVSVWSSITSQLPQKGYVSIQNLYTQYVKSKFPNYVYVSLVYPVHPKRQTSNSEVDDDLGRKKLLLTKYKHLTKHRHPRWIYLDNIAGE